MAAVLALATSLGVGVVLSRGGGPPEVKVVAAADEPAPASRAIDLNTATVEELILLPGIGPARAQAIVADRERRGPFTSVDSLDRVRGIGPRTVEGLRSYVTVASESHR